MTFNASIPNAGQSPGLFPSQSNTNFTRLKTIISGDHIFNDSVQANDGTHKQVTLTNLNANPGSLPATTNAIVFSKNDSASGVTQFYFYNGTTTQQLTPYDRLLPVRVAGSASINSLATQDLINISQSFAGTGFAFVQKAGLPMTFYNFVKTGTNSNQVDIHLLDSHDDSVGSVSKPTLEFNSGVLRVKNNDSNVQIITWSIVYNKIF